MTIFSEQTYLTRWHKSRSQLADGRSNSQSPFILNLLIEVHDLLESDMAGRSLLRAPGVVRLDINVLDVVRRQLQVNDILSMPVGTSIQASEHLSLDIILQTSDAVALQFVGDQVLGNIRVELNRQWL